MRTTIALSAICIALTAAVLTIGIHGVHAQQGQAVEPPSDANSNLAESQVASAERGQYIVHHVAMCIYCHTPRGEDGVLDEQQLLQGAPMPVASPFSRQQWAFQAPKIAGLPGGWTETDMVKFLQTGTSPTGHQPQSPMPPFRFNEEDAQAVAAHLRSLE